MKTILKAILVYAMLAVFLAGCINKSTSPPYTPVPTVIEPGLAYGDPCKPPCWRGMIPGKTTRQEAALAIDQIRSSGWASYVGEGPKGYDIQPLPSTLEGTILVSFFEGDTVSDMNGTLLFDFPVETMIKQFGEPEGLDANMDNKSKSSCAEWSPPSSAVPTMSYSVPILYPEKGLAFLMLMPSSGLGLICPAMKITAFCYYAPLTMQAALNDNHLAGLCSFVSKNLTEQHLQKWHGFGAGY